MPSTKCNYEGEKDRNGEPHGEGTAYFEHGRYSGEWSSGAFHGYGELILKTGVHYAGDFHDKKMHGAGRLRFSDGKLYEGEMRVGKMHGYGTLLQANGTYEGTFAEGKRHGKGTMWYVDNSVFVGDWRSDAICGFGKVIQDDGIVYEGKWEGGEKSGVMHMTKPSGSVYREQWFDGRRAKTEKVKSGPGKVTKLLFSEEAKKHDEEMAKLRNVGTMPVPKPPSAKNYNPNASPVMSPTNREKRAATFRPSSAPTTKRPGSAPVHMDPNRQQQQQQQRKGGSSMTPQTSALAAGGGGGVGTPKMGSVSPPQSILKNSFTGQTTNNSTGGLNLSGSATPKIVSVQGSPNTSRPNSASAANQSNKSQQPPNYQKVDGSGGNSSVAAVNTDVLGDIEIRDLGDSGSSDDLGSETGGVKKLARVKSLKDMKLQKMSELDNPPSESGSLSSATSGSQGLRNMARPRSANGKIVITPEMFKAMSPKQQQAVLLKQQQQQQAIQLQRQRSMSQSQQRGVNRPMSAQPQPSPSVEEGNVKVVPLGVKNIGSASPKTPRRSGPRADNELEEAMQLGTSGFRPASSSQEFRGVLSPNNSVLLTPNNSSFKARPSTNTSMSLLSPPPTVNQILASSTPSNSSNKAAALATDERRLLNESPELDLDEDGPDLDEAEMERVKQCVRRASQLQLPPRAPSSMANSMELSPRSENEFGTFDDDLGSTGSSAIDLDNTTGSMIIPAMAPLSPQELLQQQSVAAGARELEEKADAALARRSSSVSPQGILMSPLGGGISPRKSSLKGTPQQQQLAGNSSPLLNRSGGNGAGDHSPAGGVSPRSRGNVSFVSNDAFFDAGGEVMNVSLTASFAPGSPMFRQISNTSITSNNSQPGSSTGNSPALSAGTPLSPTANNSNITSPSTRPISSGRRRGSFHTATVNGQQVTVELPPALGNNSLTSPRSQQQQQQINSLENSPQQSSTYVEATSPLSRRPRSASRLLPDDPTQPSTSVLPAPRTAEPQIIAATQGSSMTDSQGLTVIPNLGASTGSLPDFLQSDDSMSNSPTSGNNSSRGGSAGDAKNGGRKRRRSVRFQEALDAPMPPPSA